MSGRLYANLVAVSTMAAMLAIAGCNDGNDTTPGSTPATTPGAATQSSPGEVTLTATGGGLSIPAVIPPPVVSTAGGIDMGCGIPGVTCTTTVLPSEPVLSSEPDPLPESPSGG